MVGFVRFGAEASGGSRGTGSISGSFAFLFLVRAFSTRGKLMLDDSDHLGRSRVRESRTLGSVGAKPNGLAVRGKSLREHESGSAYLAMHA